MIKNLIKEDFKRIEINSELSEIVNIMKNEEEALAVFEDGNFVGILSINDFMERIYPTNTKIKTLVKKNIPKFEIEELDFIKICKTFLENKFKAIPIFSGDELKGLIYEKDLVKNSLKFLKKSGKNTKELVEPPITITQEETVGRARNLMKKEMISRLPVIDEDGKIIGIVESKDFLKIINLKEGPGPGEIIGNQIKEDEFLVTSIMEKQFSSIEEPLTWENIIENMKKNNKSYVLILKNNKPVGIITSKDILEIIASTEKKEGIYVQITGFEHIENVFDREKIDSMIEDFIQKIGKIYKNIEYMFIHIKTSQDTGGDKLYLIRARILTPAGLYVSKSTEWNAIASMNETLDRLERQIIKDHQKSKDLSKTQNN